MIRHTRDSVYMNDGRRLIRTVQERTRGGRGTGIGYAEIDGRRVELTRAGDAALGRWWVPANPDPAAPEPPEPVREIGAEARSKGAPPTIDLLHFPEFRGVLLPVSELPGDFRDCSFHEDTAPSMWSELRRVLIWFKHPDPTLRWDPDAETGRYLVERLTADGETLDDGQSVLYEGDDWAKVLEIIAAAEMQG